MRFNVAFTLIMLAAFAAMVGLAAQYPPDARFMPWIVGIPALALCLVQLGIDIRSRGAAQAGSDAADMEAGPGRAAGSVGREAAMWGYFLGLVGGIVFFGFLLAVPVFILVFLRHWARASWPLALGLVAAASAILYLVFVQGLNVALHAGFATQYVIDRFSG